VRINWGKFAINLQPDVREKFLGLLREVERSA